MVNDSKVLAGRLATVNLTHCSLTLSQAFMLTLPLEITPHGEVGSLTECEIITFSWKVCSDAAMGIQTV